MDNQDLIQLELSEKPNDVFLVKILRDKMLENEDPRACILNNLLSVIESVRNSE